MKTTGIFIICKFNREDIDDTLKDPLLKNDNFMNYFQIVVVKHERMHCKKSKFMEE